jgi:hypothetical protein
MGGLTRYRPDKKYDNGATPDHNGRHGKLICLKILRNKMKNPAHRAGPYTK